MRNRLTYLAGALALVISAHAAQAADIVDTAVRGQVQHPRRGA